MPVCSTTGVTSGSLPTRAATRRVVRVAGAEEDRVAAAPAPPRNSSPSGCRSASLRSSRSRRHRGRCGSPPTINGCARAPVGRAPPPPRRTRPGRHGRRSLWRRSLELGTDATPTCHRCSATSLHGRNSNDIHQDDVHQDDVDQKDVDEGLESRDAVGQATIVDEVALPQRAGERRFRLLVQLLEDARGERLVLRIRHRGHGSARTRDAACARPRQSFTMRCGTIPNWRRRWSVAGSRPAARPQAPGTARTQDNLDRREPPIASGVDNDASTKAPSSEPSNGSTACSGAASSPTTLPSRLQTPATPCRGAVHVRLVAEDDLVELVELCIQLVVGEPGAFTVLDGDHEPLALDAAR